MPDAVTPLSAGRRRGVICASITSWGLRALRGGSVVFQFTLGYRPVVLPFVRPGGGWCEEEGGDLELLVLMFQDRFFSPQVIRYVCYDIPESGF